MNTTVSCELHLRLVVSSESSLPVPAGLRYDTADPYAVHATFHTGAEETVEWVFADVGDRLAVDVLEVEENRKIAFDWTASGTTARVTIKLEAHDSGATLVSINEARWPFDREGVERALGQTAGWTDFLCCMKAYLQHGINLRLGRSRQSG